VATLDQLKLETEDGCVFTLKSEMSGLCEVTDELCASFMRLAVEAGTVTATIFPQLADELCPNRKVKYLAKHAKNVESTKEKSTQNRTDLYQAI
jgi:hypothetical protein